MKFTFSSEFTEDVTWEDGRIRSDSRFIRRLILETARQRESTGEWYGAPPHGPGRRSRYLSDPFSAYWFLIGFFHEQRIPVTISGEVPEPGPVPDGAVQ